MFHRLPEWFSSSGGRQTAAVVTTMMTGPLMDVFMPRPEEPREPASLGLDELTETHQPVPGVAV